MTVAGDRLVECESTPTVRLRLDHSAWSRKDTSSTRALSQFERNKAVYHARGVSRSYTASSLDRVESIVLLHYQPAIADKSVLDLGVGAGRTIDFLRPLARRYVCLDYSPEMVDVVHDSWPDVEVRLADMRDLSDWSNGAFDFVLATKNLLDTVSHEDRLTTLREVRRALSPGGLFVFSSHNRRYELAGRGPRLNYSRNPVTQLALLARYVVQIKNHWSVDRQRRVEQDYALLDDSGHDYACLHYYVDRPTQRRQLEDARFELVDVFDSSGKRLSEGGDEKSSSSLMYVARAI
jgi:SAM-dependent methyltransferase